jgi:cytochrome P450
MWSLHPRRRKYISRLMRKLHHRPNTGKTQTVIGANPWVVHRNTEVFGADAAMFRPDRWLKEDTGNMRTDMALACKI